MSRAVATPAQKLVFGDPAAIAYRDRERQRAAGRVGLGRWRKAARPIIANVIEENFGKPVQQIRDAISAAYPFGPRAHYPYKEWLKEVREQVNDYLASLPCPPRKDN